MDTLYIKGDKNVEVTSLDVRLGDILSLECSNKTILSKIKTIKLLKLSSKENDRKNRQRIVVSVLKIISCIHEQFPDLEIQNMGEVDMIITYKGEETVPQIVHVMKAVFIAAVTFCGSAFSIMAFNNDVSVTQLFAQIYESLTGIESNGFTMLEVSYSVGIAIGILLFFNHFGKRKSTADPTPLQVQMRLYEDDIQTTLIQDASRGEEELNVD